LVIGLACGAAHVDRGVDDFFLQERQNRLMALQATGVLADRRRESGRLGRSTVRGCLLGIRPRRQNDDKQA
jgi:hypothetical protein